jgi:hypothetical protein
MAVVDTLTLIFYRDNGCVAVGGVDGDLHFLASRIENTVTEKIVQYATGHLLVEFYMVSGLISAFVGKHNSRVLRLGTKSRYDLSNKVVQFYNFQHRLLDLGFSPKKEHEVGYESRHSRDGLLNLRDHLLLEILWKLFSQ